MAMFGKLKVEDFLSPKWENLSADKQKKLIERLEGAKLDLEAYAALAEQATAWEVRLIGIKSMDFTPRAVEVVARRIYNENHPQILQAINSYMNRNAQAFSTDFLLAVVTGANTQAMKSCAFALLEKRGAEITDESVLLSVLESAAMTEILKIRKIIKSIKSQKLIDALALGTMPKRPLEPKVSVAVKMLAADRPLSKDVIEAILKNTDFSPEVRSKVVLQSTDPELLKKILFNPDEPSEVKMSAAQAAVGVGLADEVFDGCDDIIIRLTALRSLLLDDNLLIDDAQVDQITNQNAIADNNGKNNSSPLKT